MFTKNELNVLREALRNWKGLYSGESNLNEGDKERKINSLKTADALAERFESILQDFYEMENKIKEKI